MYLFKSISINILITVTIFFSSKAISYQNDIKKEPLLLILINFKDSKIEKNNDYIQNLFFGQENSLRDYYEETSYGRFIIIPADENFGNKNDGIIGPILWDISKDDAPTDFRNENMAKKILELADQYVNLKLFDKNDNGEITARELHINILIPFEPQSTHHAVFTEGIIYNGINFFKSKNGGYLLCSVNENLPLFVHEFAHSLGVIEGYNNFFPKGGGTGYWDVMYYNWGGCPHLSAFSKVKAGFIDPILIDKNVKSLKIPCIENNPAIYKIILSKENPNEYLLLENRQKIGYDKDIPGEGLLVWHIDESIIQEMEAENEFLESFHKIEYYPVELITADAIPISSKNTGDAGHPFPGETGKTSLSCYSYPALKTFSANYSPVKIDNIKLIGDDIFCDIMIEPETALPVINELYFNDMKGNNDGFLNPNETVSVDIVIENIGQRELQPFNLTSKTSILNTFENQVRYKKRIKPGAEIKLKNILTFKIDKINKLPQETQFAFHIVDKNKNEYAIIKTENIDYVKQFKDVTAQFGLKLSKRCSFGSVIADLNKDDKLDFFLGGEGLLHILESGFPEPFRSLRIKEFPNSVYHVSNVDINNDGDFEIIVYPMWDSPKGKISIWEVDEKNHTWEEISDKMKVNGKNAFSGVWSDFNNDGFLDFCCVGMFGCELYFNEKGNYFIQKNDSCIPEGGFMSVSSADVNNDLYPDLLFIGQDLSTLTLLINNGDGNFVNVTELSGLKKLSEYSDKCKSWVPFAVAWGDYDNDCFIDFYICSTDNQVSILYHNLGGNRFEMIAKEVGLNHGAFNEANAKWLDFDHDGFLDLIIANEDTYPTAYRNSGNGKFEYFNKFLGVSFPHAVFVNTGDVDHDGDLDLLLCDNRTEGHKLFFNNQNDNKFLLLNLIGTKSNRMAIGTKIKIFDHKSKRLLGYREIFQEMPFAHFGLGDVNTVDVETIFPSGKVLNSTEYSSLSNIEKGHFLKVIETGKVVIN